MVGVNLNGDFDEDEEKLYLAKFIRDAPQIKVLYVTSHMSYLSEDKDPEKMMEFARIVNERKTPLHELRFPYRNNSSYATWTLECF